MWKYFRLAPDGASGPFRDPPPSGHVVARRVDEPTFYDRSARETADRRSDKEVADAYWSLFGSLCDRQLGGCQISGKEMQRLKDLEDAMVERALLDPQPDLEEASA